MLQRVNSGYVHHNTFSMTTDKISIRDSHQNQHKFQED